MIYLVGDLQGCDGALQRLLAQIDFSPSRDHVVLLGDLVNRGPQSLQVLRRLSGMGAAATCLLGNHDLHLLAVAAGVRRPHAGDTLDELIASPQGAGFVDWLRHQKLAHAEAGWLCVHAGVVPQWSSARTLALADEVHKVLRGDALADFLPQMYGNEPRRWDDALAGPARWRFIVNVLTRIRFCNDAGELDFKTKEAAGAALPGYRPWFEIPGRLTAEQPVAFGHWSTLGLVSRPDLLALDTGCVWGGALSAMRVDGGRRELHQVACAKTP